MGHGGNQEPPAPSAWAPLRVAAFRALWTAQLFSLIGTWMQTVGAQWLLVDEPDAATLVGLVQTAAMLPTLLLALPAGALADIVDRRRLLIGVQLFQVIVGACLTVLAATDRLPPPVLLAATFLLGVGTTLTIPGYQTLVQELVGREHMRSAAALNGVAMNLARAIGPAVAGLLIGQLGVTVVFALNALTYLAMAAVLVTLRPPSAPEQLLPERFGGACSPAPAMSATRRWSGGCCCAPCCSWCRARRCGRCSRWWPASCSGWTRSDTACCSARSGSARWRVPPCCPGSWRCCRPPGSCSSAGSCSGWPPWRARTRRTWPSPCWHWYRPAWPGSACSRR